MATYKEIVERANVALDQAIGRCEAREREILRQKAAGEVPASRLFADCTLYPAAYAARLAIREVKRDVHLLGF